jgi:hypothetical protein
MFKKYFLLILCMFLFSPQYIQAEPGSVKIVEVALAREVVDLQPQEVFDPPAYCGRSEDRQNTIPIVHSTTDSKICLWTKVKSPAAETLIHTWYKAGMGWEKMAEVKLNVQPSAGFRTWSCKKIIPQGYNGKWMVVISTASDPENALCKVDFEIQE